MNVTVTIEPALQPWSDNSWYWSYHDTPLLLLGASDDDNLFQWSEAPLLAQLDQLVNAGGNVIRNTMSDRKSDGNFEVYPFHQQPDGKYDLNQTNSEYWNRFERLLSETAARGIIVQIEIWDRFDYSKSHWDIHPYNPANNINYTTGESGLAESYPDEADANTQPFFFTTPYQQDNTVVFHYQQQFVDKMLDHSLPYDHVIYCIDNETSGEEEWSRYWAEYVQSRAEAQGRQVFITEMWDDWDLTAPMHKQTFDHPEMYAFVDVSQNNHMIGKEHWDNFIYAREYLSAIPRPMNTTKTYGADSDIYGSDQDGIERFWRHLLAGAASMRFHRPTAGIGLNDKAVAAIRSARKLESVIPLWLIGPTNELLSGHEENEAYLAADAPHQSFAIYFPSGGGVQVDVSAVSGEMVGRWINIDSGEWGPYQTFDDADTISVVAPDIGNWAVAVVPNTEPPSTTVPTADAGADQNIFEGASATLDGTGSYDPDGTITAYEWKEGNTVLSTAAVFDKQNFGVGIHTITLMVTDDNGTTAIDNMTVTVVPPANTPYIDDFSTDSTSEYVVDHNWTDGSVGSFGHDSAGQRIKVLTGDNIALEFSRALSASTDGSFSIDFLPTVNYPNGGVVTLKLQQDADTFYKIENTDGYGPGEISKYVNAVKVDSAPFSNEYVQGVNHTISVTFSPSATTVQAFGETVVMNSDSTAITVSSFSVNTFQQDAYYDNVLYSITQPGGNIIPIAVDDSTNVEENSSVSINVLVNDYDIDGSLNPASITVVTDASHGSASAEANGTVTYTPAPGYIGPDLFTYTVADNDGLVSNTATVNLTVTAPPENIAPTASDDSATVEESDSVDIDVLANDSDSDGSLDTASVTVVTDASHGSTSVNTNGIVTYIPQAGYVGPDLFTYTVADDDGAVSNTATVNLMVLAIDTTFTDDFSTDTTSQYTTEDTWTQGGVGSFTYDASGQRVHVQTANDVALQFSRALPASEEGGFSIDFLPTVHYPSGGIITLRLLQDDQNYYEISNTDNYGPRGISKYVNGVEVDSAQFDNEYMQEVNYTLSITFTPTVTTVEAFGETVIMNSDSTAITVSSFSVNTTQQSAYYDNIVYSIVLAGSNLPPVANAGIDKSVQVNQPITITGSGTDIDGMITAYEWKKESTVLASTASFEYIPDTVGTDTLTLTVTDNEGAVGTDEMNVTVTEVPPVNTPPIADAGTDQNVDTGTIVTLDGSGSSDAEGDALTYLWSMTDRPLDSSALLSDTTAVNPTFIADTDGTYTLSLIVNDGTEDSIADTVTVTASTSSILAFRDDFSADTTSEYTVEHTWTQGGVGSFGYDGGGQRAKVLTGNDISLTFFHDLPASTEGSFSIDFHPTVHYPSGGIFTLRLIQDADTYYEIENTDNYGPRSISKHVNGLEVDSAVFTNEYIQGTDYTISISFSPGSTTVQAFGETLTINSDNTDITVGSFSVRTLQQDAFYDNIVYDILTPITLVTPQANHIQVDGNLSVTAVTSTLQSGWGVKFVLDEGTGGEQVIIDKVPPYEVVFLDINQAEHTVDAYIVDESDIVQTGEENHDGVQNVARGDILVAYGNSITYGYNDDLSFDDSSSDGRNTGGGFEPILNDHLTLHAGYPHSVINEGTTGMLSAEGLAALPAVLAKHPQATSYLLMLGTNDSNVFTTVPTATFKQNMQDMIDLINAAGKKVMLAKLPVALGDRTTGTQYVDLDAGTRNVTIQSYNEAIDELAADPDNNITVTPPDFYTHFKTTYLNEYSDNLHPNGFGYDSMANLWRNALTQ